MNPQSPREELEIRITALLMGELPADEAAALQTQIAADAELNALHARLQRALGLLREASTAQEPHALQPPMRLSDERRARLFAYFKGESKPGPVIVKPRRDWKWAVPLGLAASLMALIGGAMFVNGFALRKGSAIRETANFTDRDGDVLSMKAESAGLGGNADEKRRAGSRLIRSVDELSADRLADSATSAVKSQIAKASHDKDGSRTTWGAQPGMNRVDDATKATHNDRLPDGAFAGRAAAGNAVPEPASDRARFASAAHSRLPELNPSERPRIAAGGPVGTGGVYLPPAAAKTAADFDAGIGNFSDGAGAGAGVSDPFATAGLATAKYDRAPSSEPNGPRGGAVKADSDKPVSGGDPGFFAGSFWDTPRVQTQLDRATSDASNVAGYRGGLASSQPAADDFQRAPSRAGTSDLNGFSSPIGSVSSAGVVTKIGSGTLTLSSANAYSGGTTIAAGTLQPQIAGGGGAGAKPAAQPADTSAPARPMTADHFASYKTEGESRDALGTANRNLGVVELKGGTTFNVRIPSAEEPMSGEKRSATPDSPDLASKDLRDTDGKPASPTKPAAGSTIEGAKGDTNGRWENRADIAGAGLPAGATPAPGLALGNQPAPATSGFGFDGDIRVDYGVPLKETAGQSPGDGKFQFNVGDKLEAAASEDGRKAALNPNVREFEGFINFGGAIAGKPAAAPQPAVAGESGDRTRWLEVTRNGTIANPVSNATSGARRTEENPVVGRIAFWADDDTAKVNIHTAGGTVDSSGSAQVTKPALPGAVADFGTISGVVAATGDVNVTKSGAGNWQLGGANTFTGGMNVNAGTLTFNGGAATNIAAASSNETLGALTATSGTNSLAPMPSDNKLWFNGAGTSDVTFGGVITKSGQSASGEANRHSNVQAETQAPEMPEIIGNTRTRSAGKAGNGTLILGTDGTSVAVTDVTNGTVYLGTRSTRGTAPDLGRALEIGARADMEKTKESGAAAKDGKLSGRYGFEQREAGLVLGEGRGNAAADNDRDQSAATKGRAAHAESRLSAGKIENLKAKGEKQVADSETETDMRKLLAVEQNLDRAKMPEPMDERRRDSLLHKSNAAVLADAPVNGTLTVSGLPSAQAAAPAGESAEVEKKAVEESLREEQSPLSVIQTAAPGDPAAAEALRKLSKPQPEQKQKKLSETVHEKSEVMELKKEVPQIQEAEPADPKPAPNPLVPQPEIRTSANAFSTFSLNVSDVAFKLAAASLERGVMPDVSTLRSEEFINAFDYRDPEARAGAPLAFVAERARYPFAQNRDLLRLAVKTAAAGRAPGKPLNLVLLLDNSGSMERADRTRILREAMRVLSAQLQPQDKLSIVTFARTPRLWADGVSGDKAGEVTARVGEITPEGGTNLAAALDLGYATALKHYQPGSVNHVVVLTDGAANLGDVDPAALKQKVEAHRKQGVALDCFGIGWEGLNDDMLEQLSRNGDGRYGFINTPEEAATNFAAQLAGALRVAASDVKVQVEWNPKRVTAYRQVGYAKHQLTKEQFRDNTVDAAELAAAESGNALYVVEVNPRGTGDLAIVRVRFKVPGTSDYREHEWTVPFGGNAAPLEQSSSTLRLAGAAAAFSEMLASSPFATEVTSDRLLGLLNGVPAIYGADARPKKLEWMIRQAKSLSGR